MTVANTLALLAHLLYCRSEVSSCTAPTNNKQVARVITIDCLLWNVGNNSRHLCSTGSNHNCMVCRVVRDISGCSILLQTANTMLKVSRSRERPTTNITLIALVWHKVALASNSDRRINSWHISHLRYCPRLRRVCNKAISEQNNRSHVLHSNL